MLAPAVAGDSLQRLASDAIRSAGYAGLAAIMALEVVFPPIPSEIVLPLAGFEVGRGAMTFVLALLAATLGATAGSLVLYALARYGGRPAVMRLAPLLRVSERDLDRADAWFDRRGTWIVFGGRMLPGARSLVSIPAGLSEMPLWRYLAATAAGSALWSALLIGIGVALGSNYDRVEQYVGPASTAVLAVVVLGAVAGALWLRRRRREPVAA